MELTKEHVSEARPNMQLTKLTYLHAYAELTKLTMHTWNLLRAH